MRKGAVDILTLLVVGIAVAVLGRLAYDYAQPNYAQPKFGASTQTQLSDTINTFRTNVNTNFSNIDTQIASITSTQATYGTIVTENTPLAKNKGGTGTTTVPTNGQFLSASDTTPTWKSFIFGSGINSTVTPTSVTIGTQGFDQTANYTLSGSWTFQSSTLLATATSGVVTTDATGKASAVQPGQSGNILQSNGSGWVSNTTIVPVRSISVLSASVNVQTSTFTLVQSTTMPTYGTSTYYIISGHVGSGTGVAASTTVTIGNTTVLSCTYSSIVAIDFNLWIQMRNSTTSAWANGTINCGAIATSSQAVTIGSSTLGINIKSGNGTVVQFTQDYITALAL